MLGWQTRMALSSKIQDNADLNDEALLQLASYFKGTLKNSRTTTYSPDSLIKFAATDFIAVETESPIQLLPHQQSILRLMFDLDLNFQTLVYSTVKKSGKTTIAGLVARWIAENWGPKSEVYCIANDMEQARGRIYQKALESIELNPSYNRIKRELPGKWRIIERDAVHLPTRSILKAVSSDYKGEAGSNPTATLWSELWGYSSEASHRLWDELTPVPTRARSIRFVETYAGFEDESDLLLDLYKLTVIEGQRLTHEDLAPYGGWPFPDQPPIYVNKAARSCAYWDNGIIARRMPWQTPEYYAAQEAQLRPMAYRRLHLNEWTSTVSEFIPIEWWRACKTNIPGLDKDTPVVMAVDASVSSDCTGITLVSRSPNDHNKVMVRDKRLWIPPKGGVINLSAVEQEIRNICATKNVVQVAYDAYQLHKMMTDLTRDGIAWCKPFSQAGDRNKADKQLYDMIRDRMIEHDGDSDFEDHIKNCAAKTSKDEDTKLRIVKKSQSGKIDLAICLSMATFECLRLLL